MHEARNPNKRSFTYKCGWSELGWDGQGLDLKRGAAVMWKRVGEGAHHCREVGEGEGVCGVVIGIVVRVREGRGCMWRRHCRVIVRWVRVRHLIV